MGGKQSRYRAFPCKKNISLAEVKVRYADLYRHWETAPHTVRFPRGETLDEVRDRAVEVVVQRHPDQVVLLAAHRAVNKVLIAALIGLNNSHFWRLGQDTTALTASTGWETPGTLWA
jgi:broad specificity phosphatase PhoE